MARPLSLALLQDPPGAVHVPSYRPDEISPGIVHFGIGNFHRAHQALYLDRLFDLGDGRDWGIVGAGVRGLGRGDAQKARGDRTG